MAQKILIVDDNAATRGDLVKLLADAGFETSTAATVPEAMRALATNAPNLLITEIRLDSYNGLHLIAMAPKPIPAIVITGFPDRGVEADARRLGAEYLAKPVSPGELYATVQRTLSTAASRGVFMPPRADPRTDCAPNTMVLVNDSPACLLDVSAGGARIEIQCAPGATCSRRWRSVSRSWTSRCRWKSCGSAARAPTRGSAAWPWPKTCAPSGSPSSTSC
jgi:DNA-binding response OmpR family regulator